MVLLDSLLVGGIEDAPDFVFFLIKKDIVVRYPEFIRGCVLEFAKLLRSEWFHLMLVHVFWHPVLAPFIQGFGVFNTAFLFKPCFWIEILPSNNNACNRGLARLWAGYVTGWTAWNHVRTALALAAAASLTIALLDITRRKSKGHIETSMLDRAILPTILKADTRSAAFG
jgi:hypothetical protein